MGLFSSPKIPGIDAGALSRLAEQNAAKQRDLIERRKMMLAPLTQQFQTGREALSARVMPETENLLTKYGQDIQGVGAQERQANAAATIGQREQAFRNVPELQRSIRESLGGNQLLRTGGAVGQIAQPVLEAARSSRDFSNALETSQLANEARRSENMATTGFQTRGNALNQRLGIDENTLNELTNMGRGDLVQEYQDLLGTQEQLGANQLNIEQARQANDIAQAQAAAARRGNVISGLTQLGGAGIGFATGGPMGAALGAQLGGTVGQFANGSPVSFDPTLLYALAQRNPQRRTAVVNGLQTPVRPY